MVGHTAYQDDAVTAAGVEAKRGGAAAMSQNHAAIRPQADSASGAVTKVMESEPLQSRISAPIMGGAAKPLGVDTSAGQQPAMESLLQQMDTTPRFSVPASMGNAPQEAHASVVPTSQQLPAAMHNDARHSTVMLSGLATVPDVRPSMEPPSAASGGHSGQQTKDSTSASHMPRHRQHKTTLFRGLRIKVGLSATTRALHGR
jgi:hypothetical protein